MPLPNIGIMLCRGGSSAVVRMFGVAWQDYQASSEKGRREVRRDQPGRDQNKVTAALRSASRADLRWGYFSTNATVLLDKMYKFETPYLELGGDLAQDILDQKGVVAVHTTCYENDRKADGLKSANAYRNPAHYRPGRRTLTKMLFYDSRASAETARRLLLQEVQTLLLLAARCNRSLLLPNLMLLSAAPPRRPLDRLWPAYRVLRMKPSADIVRRVRLVEASYYWKLRQLYGSVDAPTIVRVSPSTSLQQMEAVLSQRDEARLLLVGGSAAPSDAQLLRWSAALDGLGGDAAGDELTAAVRQAGYWALPPLPKNPITAALRRATRLCEVIFGPTSGGNRSCFAQCG